MPLYLWSLWCFIYLKNFFATFLLCDAMHKRSLCRHAVSVCVSVTFVNCVKTSNHILGLFLLSGSHTILVFPYQTSRHYSNRDPPNGGIECKGRQKSRFWPYAWLQCLLLTLQQARCCQHSRRWTTATIPQLMTHITGRTLQVFDHQVPRMITSHQSPNWHGVQLFRRMNRKMTNVQLLAFFTLQPLSLDFTSHRRRGSIVRDRPSALSHYT